MSQEYLRIDEVARRLRVGYRTVQRHFERGNLTPIRISKRCTLIDAAEVEAFLKQSTGVR